MTASATSNTNCSLPMNAYDVSVDPARLDLAAIHAFLSTTYWSPGVPLQVVTKAIENSVCVGAYSGSSQVGFARMVTDKATFAYLADVYVLQAHRGNGLSRRMMEALLQHPELQGLRRMMLVTRDAHGLYDKFGFKPLAAPERLMERFIPNAYGAPAPAEAARDSASRPAD
jgi:GNAT superfamily N-acetyltransferase